MTPRTAGFGKSEPEQAFDSGLRPFGPRMGADGRGWGNEVAIDRGWTTDGGASWGRKVGYPRASAKSAVVGSVFGGAVWLSAQRCPGLLRGDIHERGAFENGRGKNREEHEVAGPGVVGAMDHIDRDVRHVAGTEQAFLAIDPLLGFAFDDIDDLLHRGVSVELVGLAAGHGDPDEQEFLGLSQSGPAEPFVWAPGELLDLNVIGLDESEQGLWRVHGRSGGVGFGLRWSQFVNAELEVGNAQLYCLRDPATGADKTGRSRSGGFDGAAASDREKEAIQESGIRVAAAARTGLRAGNGGAGGE